MSGFRAGLEVRCLGNNNQVLLCGNRKSLGPGNPLVGCPTHLEDGAKSRLAAVQLDREKERERAKGQWGMPQGR